MKVLQIYGYFYPRFKISNHIKVSNFKCDDPVSLPHQCFNICCQWRTGWERMKEKKTKRTRREYIYIPNFHMIWYNFDWTCSMSRMSNVSMTQYSSSTWLTQHIFVSSSFQFSVISQNDVFQTMLLPSKLLRILMCVQFRRVLTGCVWSIWSLLKLLL